MNHGYHVETNESLEQRPWQGPGHAVCGTEVWEFSTRTPHKGALAVFNYDDVKQAIATDPQAEALRHVCRACLTAMQ